MTSHPLLPLEIQANYRRLGYWEGITLGEVVAERAAKDPERAAIVGPEPLTYSDLHTRARRLAGYLVDAGMQPGEFLLAVQSNSWQGVVLSIAASIAGIALSPLSARVSPTLALNLFEQVGCRGVLLEAELLHRPEWREMFDTVRFRDNCRPVMLRGTVAGDLQQYGSLPTLEHACATGREISQRAKDPTRPALVLCTGGSTGVPKSVVHCEESLVYAGRNFARGTDFTENDVYVAFGPYGHASGSVFDVYMPLLAGAPILPNARWKAQPVAEAIARYGGTYCITVGTHVFDLLALERGTEPLLKSMRLVVSGAGPDHLFEDAERRFGFRVVRDYGLSECLGHAPGRPSDAAAVRLHKDGVPFPGLEYRITEPGTSKPMPVGQAGEYVCRGPSLFMGYFGQPELTRGALTEDGFYQTGDLMIASDEGYISCAGRIKDVIRRGGLQIDVLEMERLLAEHPQIAEVVVVGTAHPRLGEQAVIVAIAKSAHERPPLEELVAHLLQRGLPKECLPERLLFTVSLPRTEWGKFNRVELRKWVAAQPLEQAPAACP
ncbi:MAG: class I adenylate-forming enzyme family protein [Steroidobacteraceae bacterium]